MSQRGHTGAIVRHITVFALSGLSIWGLWLLATGERLAIGWTALGALALTLVTGVVIRPRHELRDPPEPDADEVSELSPAVAEASS